MTFHFVFFVRSVTVGCHCVFLSPLMPGSHCQSDQCHQARSTRFPDQAQPSSTNWLIGLIWKGYGAKWLVKEFPTRDWNIPLLNNLLCELRETGTTDRRIASGRLRSVCTNSSIIAVDELVLSQEDAPETHHTKSAERPVSLKLVTCNDLQLNCLKSWGSDWLKRCPQCHST